MTPCQWITGHGSELIRDLANQVGDQTSAKVREQLWPRLYDPVARTLFDQLGSPLSWHIG